MMNVVLQKQQFACRFVYVIVGMCDGAEGDREQDGKSSCFFFYYILSCFSHG